MKAPPILILDEATSALDSPHRTGNSISALDQVSKRSHDALLNLAQPSVAVVGAHEIIVLDSGMIAEPRNSQELTGAGRQFTPPCGTVKGSERKAAERLR